MNGSWEELDATGLDRVVLIDDQGKRVEEWDVSVKVSIQDYGKTLKVFMNKKK